MKTVGIIGDGQLAQLLGLSAYPLGLNTFVYATQQHPPAERFNTLLPAFENPKQALQKLAQHCDVITFETENVPEALLEALDSVNVPVHPRPAIIRQFQHRFYEKQRLTEAGIPTPSYQRLRTLENLTAFMNRPGIDEAIIKVAQFGYDGKGHYRVKRDTSLSALWNEISGKELIIEQKLEFDYEVSLISARDSKGHVIFYPLIKNTHEEGILKYALFPFEDATLQQKAQNYAYKLLNKLDYQGVMTMEFFVCQGELIANEIAPRVHNSGHLTIEASNCSQFENHLRAVAGRPLVNPEATRYCYLANIIGQLPQWDQWPNSSNFKCYLYGKAPKPKRKLGHMTLTGDSLEELNGCFNY